LSTVRKIPMRKCVGCNEKKSKKELIRVLRTPEGQITIDATGRKNGRGAYICPNSECLKKAIRNKGIARSLDVSIPQEIYDELQKEMSAIEQE